jgi:glycosyltransferase involved in cell wall biosynthesis
MNIGFDGKRAANNLTGLGNYSRSLIAHMARYFPQNQYFVYTAKVKEHKQIQSFLSLPGIVLKLAETSVLGMKAAFLWRSYGVVKQLKRDGIELYHGLSQELPFGISKQRGGRFSKPGGSLSKPAGSLSDGAGLSDGAAGVNEPIVSLSDRIGIPNAHLITSNQPGSTPTHSNRAKKPGEIKYVVTIHDLIYLRFPQYYPFVDRLIYTFKARHACKHADGIIAISENTKRDLVQLLNVPPSRIKVIYQSCDDAFKQALPAAFKEKVKAKYNLPDKYLLNVGTIEPRKNLKLIVQALALLPEDTTLVVIGKPHPAYAATVKQEMERLNLTSRILFLKDVSFVDLPAIYQLAHVFVYPSFYEGFGIPILEALYSGVPVVAATGSCLEEAGGPDSLYVDPNDPEQLANRLNWILTDESRRLLMIENGLQFAQRFDQAIISRELENYYKEVLKGD